ncbi:MAG TPA: hypothetical protein VML55_20695 [Planctomycetaceae bacterium]|nr:hypothetical protein [Planctomycetaceae bacterium]
MHKLGIVFVWLTVLCAIAASLLTAKMFNVRNTWARKVEQLEASVQQNEQQIREKRTQLDRLQTDYEQVIVGWDRYWDGVPTQPVPNAPMLVTDGLGLNQGLRLLNPVAPATEPSPPEVHVFRLNQDGSSAYLGPFRARQIFDTRAELEASWRVRGPEVQQWAAGPMRHRTLIPTGFKEAYQPLHRELALADENLLRKQRDLAQLTDLDQRAVEQLQFRRTELDDALAGVKAAEEERAAELAEVDKLRRELQDAHRLMEELIAANRRLEQTLPRPASQVTSE